MKTYFLVFGLVLLSSCSGLLKEVPPSLLSPENFYKSKGDFDLAVVGTYRSLFHDYKGFDCPIPLIMTSGGEDLKSFAPIYKNFDLLRVTPEEANTIVPMWGSLYKAIGNANYIIGRLKDAPIADNDKKEADGQARFLRALSYFYLTRWFGEVQLVTYENRNNVSTLKEAPVADIYALIVEDLTLAANELPTSFPEEYRGKANKWAATALLSKVYLTMAGWPLNQTKYYESARDKAKEVIDAGAYALEANFADLWVNANRLKTKEFIFAFYGSVDSEGTSGTILDLPSTPNTFEGKGWGDFRSETRFYNKFPAGPRKSATFIDPYPDGTTIASSGADPFISKYKDAGRHVGFRGEGVMVILRYADILLIYAEAANKAEGSPSVLAIEYLNKVKRRALGLPIDVANTTSDVSAGISQADFHKAVIDERNWELAGEGNRWFDLVRLEMVVSANADRISENDITNLTPDDALFPKPLAQLIAGLVTQNKGY